MKLLAVIERPGCVNVCSQSTGDSLDDDDDGGGGEGSVHANKEVEKNTALNAGAPVVSTCGSLQPTHHRCNVPEANVVRLLLSVCCLSLFTFLGGSFLVVIGDSREDGFSTSTFITFM